jgi:hypothetical protein
MLVLFHTPPERTHCSRSVAGMNELRSETRRFEGSDRLDRIDVELQLTRGVGSISKPRIGDRPVVNWATFRGVERHAFG